MSSVPFPCGEGHRTYIVHNTYWVMIMKAWGPSKKAFAYKCTHFKQCIYIPMPGDLEVNKFFSNELYNMNHVV